ncbi:MAG: class I SAM-dependent methyltransferase, partial [Verrucomicrobia bacterium]|nr:class I SAM-dependent methyltransferase [Verrucomicrobiota bacterium]
AEKDDFSRERYRQFARHLPKKCRKVLDLGCCTGVGGAELKLLRPTLEIHGFDCSATRLAQLPPAYSAGYSGNATQMRFADCDFDAVVMGEFIEHLYPHDVDPCLHEVHRILSVGGRVLLTTPNPEGFKKRILRQTIFTVGHLSQHFSSVLVLRLRMAGFSRVRVYGSGRSLRYLPERFPLKQLFGSLLFVGDKI